MLTVDDEAEFDSERFRGRAAELHSNEKYFKIVHNGADARIYLKVEHGAPLVLIYRERGFFDGVVNSVVNIEG